MNRQILTEYAPTTRSHCHRAAYSASNIQSVASMLSQHMQKTCGDYVAQVELTCSGVEDGRGCRVSREEGVEADDVFCVRLK